MTMRTSNVVKTAGRMAALAIVAAACGRAEASPNDARNTANPAEPRVVTVIARDFAFEAPSQVPAGLVTFELQNRGNALHHVSLVRLDDGKTLADVYAALRGGASGPPPAWMHDMGGPNAPDPGHNSNATMFLAPGTYALLCWVDIPDHVPHVMKGMAKQITVTPAAVPAAAATPAGDITMRLNDYSFRLSRAITAGEHTIRVENGAAQSHEVELIKLAPGKTTQDLMNWFQTMAGPPPASAIGGISGLGRGQVQAFSHTFTPGTYVLICFLPDAGDGKPHFMHGMIQTITVS
ncbi:MAG TPA: hypothetical protein VFJ16_09515 [Longimicrobium sp.]|nr:hypothetical protein [Longimicrobium sp.]